MKPFRVSLIATTLLVAAIVVPTAQASRARLRAPASAKSHVAINCAWASGMCTEVNNSWAVFGHYVGHDEPSLLFDSKVPGSGNRMSYNLTLPTDPSASNPDKPGKSYAFELSGAEWLGMAICDTQSYPEQVSTCPPDSDKNILDPAVSPKHVGEAYMEMQFYPPGWVPWPTWAVAVGSSACDPTHWCAALNIDSLSLNPVTGQTNNTTCLNKVGEEYINFAFITKNGVAQAPANPVDANLTTFTPDPSRDLFMNSGDHLQVAFTDTPDGLRVIIHDASTGRSGSMTASPANGFAQVKFDPNGNLCAAIPYAFHPMYSTSTPQTRVTWAAGSYNVAFDTEIGHFQFCHGPNQIPATPFGLDQNGNPTTCPAGNTEGELNNPQPSDVDDLFCFPASEALTYKVAGCAYTNTGFDGASYQPLWPDSNTNLHPTPFQFSSAVTGRHYDMQYDQVGFETDLPDIETTTCNRLTGAGCTLVPTTDTGQPAAFYPFFSDTRTDQDFAARYDKARGCIWQFGNDIPGEITDFGRNAQYGTLYPQTYTIKGGGSQVRFNDFKNVIENPCTQGGRQQHHR